VLLPTGFSRFWCSLLGSQNDCKWLWPLRKMVEIYPQLRYGETNIGPQINCPGHEISVVIGRPCKCISALGHTNNSHVKVSFGCNDSREQLTVELSTASYSNNEPAGHFRGTTRQRRWVIFDGVLHRQTIRRGSSDLHQASSLANSYALRISAHAASSLASELTLYSEPSVPGTAEFGIQAHCAVTCTPVATVARSVASQAKRMSMPFARGSSSTNHVGA